MRYCIPLPVPILRRFLDTTQSTCWLVSSHLTYALHSGSANSCHFLAPCDSEVLCCHSTKYNPQLFSIPIIPWTQYQSEVSALQDFPSTVHHNFFFKIDEMIVCFNLLCLIHGDTASTLKKFHRNLPIFF